MSKPNGNNENRRSVSMVQEQMEKNVLFELWTQTWGVKVYPWYAVDKLKFSFIEKGQEGKGKSFSICMDANREGINCFSNWAYDILHDRRFESVLAAEAKNNEKYPKYYRYVTGDNAEKSIGVMNSSKGGYCLNASIPGPDGKKIFANIPLGFHDLRILAERFERSYQTRLDQLEEIRVQAEKRISEEIGKYAKAGNNKNASNTTNSMQQSSNDSQTHLPEKSNSSITPQDLPEQKVKITTFAPYKFFGKARCNGADGSWFSFKAANDSAYTVLISNKILENLGSKKDEFMERVTTNDCSFKFSIEYLEKSVLNNGKETKYLECTNISF